MKKETIIAILMLWVIYPVLAQQPAQQTFPSAADATRSLLQAVQDNNEGAITKILGGPTDLTSSRDPGQDKVDRELFVQKYQQMHRLCRNTDGSMTLHIGAENWPFPIPLVEKSGVWHFDPERGGKEVLFRRIGENELTAIAICHEFVAAERNFRARPNTATEADTSPMSLVARAATQSSASDPVLFHGYYFKVLSAANGQGKTNAAFAVIAYPAQYRSSGVMTFVATGKDVVYEKDLGANTSAVASGTAAFRKDGTWRAADE